MKTKVDGKLIKVNGKNMHIRQMGTGDKTIVYLLGYGEPLPTAENAPLMRMLAENTTTCLIDYFGYGFSDSTERGHTNENYVQEIREVLAKSDLKPPYVLMPYSCSGIYAEYYAHKYPDEIEAIIMLDCTSTAEPLDLGHDLLDIEKVTLAINEWIALGNEVPKIGTTDFEQFCQIHLKSYYETYLADGYTKEDLDVEVLDMLIGMVEIEIETPTPEEIEAYYAEYLPLGYTKEELDLLTCIPNHDETLNAQYKALPENVKEVMALTHKIADQLPILMFNAPARDNEHQTSIDNHLKRLGNVKKHIVVDGSDHGTITLYHDLITSEVNEFLAKI